RTGGHCARLPPHAEPPGEFRVGPGRVLDQERPFQTLEQPLLARAAQLLAQPGQALFQQRQRPTALEQGFRRRLVARLPVVAPLPAVEVERQRLASAASFPCLGPLVLLGQEVLEGRQQKRPEPAALPVRLLEVVLLQQPAEELLGQVLSVRGVGQPPPGVRIEGVPVQPAEGCQGGLRLGRIPLCRRHDDTPARAGEPPVRELGRIAHGRGEPRRNRQPGYARCLRVSVAAPCPLSQPAVYRCFLALLGPVRRTLP